MFFTLEDYKKIYEWILRNSIKDTEFVETTNELKELDIFTLVHEGINMRISFKDLVNLLFLIGVSDFLNITDRYNESNITLEKAISLVPCNSRKIGLVISFINEKSEWKIYLFKGELNLWEIVDLWEDLLDFNKYIINSILPDEEDLTKTLPDTSGNSYLSIKDREYNPEDFSGMGKVILRKNIVEVEDPVLGKVKKNVLDLDVFTQEHTIYEIRYDYDLLNSSITIPDDCILAFVGGRINNGTIIGTHTKLICRLQYTFNNITFSGIFNVDDISPCNFGARSNRYISADTYAPEYNSTDAILQAINSGFPVRFPNGAFYIDNTIIIPKGTTVICSGGNYFGVDSNYKTNRSISNTVIFTDKGIIMFDIRGSVNWYYGIINMTSVSVELEGIAFNFNSDYANWNSNIYTSIYGNIDNATKKLSIIAYKFDCDKEDGTRSGYLTVTNLQGFVSDAKVGLWLPKGTQKGRLFRWATGVKAEFDTVGCRICHLLESGSTIYIGGQHQSRFLFSKEERALVPPTLLLGCISVTFKDNIKYWDYGGPNPFLGFYTSKYVIIDNYLEEGATLEYSALYTTIIPTESIIKEYINNTVIVNPNAIFLSRRTAPVLNTIHMAHEFAYNYALHDFLKSYVNNNFRRHTKTLLSDFYFKLYNLDGKEVLEVNEINRFGILYGNGGQFTVPASFTDGYLEFPVNQTNTPEYYETSIFALSYIIANNIHIYKLELLNSDKLVHYTHNEPVNLIDSNFSKYILLYNIRITEQSTKFFRIYIRNSSGTSVNLKMSMALLVQNIYGYVPITGGATVDGDIININGGFLYRGEDTYPHEYCRFETSLYRRFKDYTKLPLAFNITNDLFLNGEGAVKGVLAKFDNKWYTWDGELASIPRYGSELPTDTPTRRGFMYYYTTNSTPIFYDGTRYRSYDGAIYNVRRYGTFDNKPNTTDNFIPIGFHYFCTDRQTAEGGTNGIEIIHRGNNVWVDALGRTVS